MNNTCKFNLVKYVYGRCYEAHLLNQPLKIKSQWKNVIKWLNTKNYITHLKLNPDNVIQFDFNTSDTMYEYYLRGIERNVKLIKNNADCGFVPMSEIIGECNVSEFEQERLDSFKNAVEYINRNDRVRRTMTYDEIYN